TEYHEAQKRYTEATEKLKTEQTALESAYETRVTEWKGRAEAENAALRAQITSIEKQKGDTERELDARRLRWQEELRVKEQALKEVQNTVTPQETELRKRYAAEEESLTRELDGLKVRLRTLEREYARTRENIEKTEKEQLSVMQALQDDHRQKEEALRARSAELTDRLKKRLEERHLALEAFLLMKKNEESRVQNELRTKEKERVELSTRLQTLPQELAYALENHKKTVQKETEQLRGRLQALESDLAKAR